MIKSDCYATMQVRLWPCRPLTQHQEETTLHDWHSALRSMGYQLVGEQLQLLLEPAWELTSTDIVNVIAATLAIDSAVMLDVHAAPAAPHSPELCLRVNLDHGVTANICQLYMRHVLASPVALASLMALTHPSSTEIEPSGQ